MYNIYKYLCVDIIFYKAWVFFKTAPHIITQLIRCFLFFKVHWWAVHSNHSHSIWAHVDGGRHGGNPQAMRAKQMRGGEDFSAKGCSRSFSKTQTCGNMPFFMVRWSFCQEKITRNLRYHHIIRADLGWWYLLIEHVRVWWRRKRSIQWNKSSNLRGNLRGRIFLLLSCCRNRFCQHQLTTWKILPFRARSPSPNERENMKRKSHPPNVSWGGGQL